MATKDVYIHGSDDGKIRWVEATSTNLCSDSCEWSDAVRFRQHPSSAKAVYYCADGNDLLFTLDEGEGDGKLSSRTFELSPSSTQKVVLQPKDESSQGTHQGQRWYGGYVQKT